MRPAAVSHTDTTIDTNWAKRMDEEVFKTFKYCNISGNDMSRNARKNRKPLPIKESNVFSDNALSANGIDRPIQVLSK